MESFVYHLPASVSAERLGRQLPEESGLELRLDHQLGREGLLLDTFDGALYNSGKILFSFDEGLLLFDLHDGRVLEQAGPFAGTVIGDMVKGPVVDLLAELAPLRAPLPVASLRLRREEGRLVDDEGKTLVRFYQMMCGRGQGRMVGVGCSLPLRGYEEAGEVLRLALQRCGAVPCGDGKEMYEALKLSPPVYQAKPEIVLHGEAPVGDSALLLLRTFLQVARANEGGIVADSDSEFLHDYRVALRKIRSLLSLFAGVFDAAATDSLKGQLADLMRTTNGLRDLDVYLLRRGDYHALVPPSAHPGLKLLFDELLGRRHEEQRRVNLALTGKAYKRKMAALARTFSAGRGALKPGPLATEASRPFAARLILKRYRRVCKVARALDETTPDEGIHRLRIHCKKLRYLMEFFSSLFPPAEIKGVIRSLKQLQDCLGTFNDLSVQQNFLATLLASAHGGGARAVPLAYAVGALTAMLASLQARERGRVFDSLALFCGEDNRLIFAELFDSRQEDDEDTRLLQQ